jgi:hypothetical protein
MHPVHKSLLENFGIPSNVCRLGHKSVCSGLVTHQHFILCIFGRKNHDRNFAGNGMTAQFPQYRKPVEFRQLQIQQDDLGHLLLIFHTGFKPIQHGIATVHYCKINFGAGSRRGKAGKLNLSQFDINQQHAATACVHL